MTDTYRGMGRAALDREYNARATVPDIMPILAEYRARTEAAKAALPGARIGLPYGPTEPERLDIYPAATPGPAPVFVFIHGGYWRLLDAADSGFMAPYLTAAGACVVAVNYALAPAATLDEIVRQCRAALAGCTATSAASAATRRESTSPAARPAGTSRPCWRRGRLAVAPRPAAAPGGRRHPALRPLRAGAAPPLPRERVDAAGRGRRRAQLAGPAAASRAGHAAGLLRGRDGDRGVQGADPGAGRILRRGGLRRDARAGAGRLQPFRHRLPALRRHATRAGGAQGHGPSVRFFFF
ncbi:alpha/beta hydrolase [Teichococcus aestuarii]|uniref:alpha/beta hydrolase n=1 Tax=Teichococcus aestuarii TaxID=568898 RepID=UPI003613E049